MVPFSCLDVCEAEIKGLLFFCRIGNTAEGTRVQSTVLCSASTSVTSLHAESTQTHTWETADTSFQPFHIENDSAALLDEILQPFNGVCTARWGWEHGVHPSKHCNFLAC